MPVLGVLGSPLVYATKSQEQGAQTQIFLSASPSINPGKIDDGDNDDDDDNDNGDNNDDSDDNDDDGDEIVQTQIFLSASSINPDKQIFLYLYVYKYV
jgi:hypothetical protein